MPPYAKANDSDAIDDGWTITDGAGQVIAHLETETMADKLIEALDPGDPPFLYAEVAWRVSDLDGREETKDWDQVTREKLLEDHETELQDRMIERGWSVLDDLISRKNAERRELSDKPRCSECGTFEEIASTPCGSFCEVCFAGHLTTCEVCASEHRKFPLV